MNSPKNRGRTLDLTISGHQVRLSFAPEQNPTVAQQIRVSLIDAYIRRHGGADEGSA